LVPKEDCPVDLVDYLIFSKKKFQEFNKIGASLEINDIPNYYFLKKEVISWESKFWKKEFDNFYLAGVDTTFAAYDKLNKAGREHCFVNCLRTKRPYVLKHFPWYLDMNNLDDEEKYYTQSANAVLKTDKLVGMWTQKHKAYLKNKFL